MRGLIVAGGPVDPDGLRNELATGPELIIAADAGAKHLLELGIYPDFLVGDFDSLPEALITQITAAGKQIRRYPVQKDQTDLQLALDVATEAGLTTVSIWGGLGRRLDHTLGNIGLLQYAADSGIHARLRDADHELFLAGERSVVPARPGWAVSLIPLSREVIGVSTAGLKYPLDRATLYANITRGVHNQFTTAEAIVTVKAGRLLIVCFREQ
jgi:thiamine pyrophosphokinase